MSRRMRLPKAPVYGNPPLDNGFQGSRNDHKFMRNETHFTLHMIQQLNRHVPRKHKKRGLRFAHNLIRADRNLAPQDAERIFQLALCDTLQKLGQG